jgi:hypothetical protein
MLLWCLIGALGAEVYHAVLSYAQPQAPPSADQTQVQLVEMSRKQTETICAQSIAALQKQVADKDAELSKLKAPAHKDEKK